MQDRTNFHQVSHQTKFNKNERGQPVSNDEFLFPNDINTFEKIEFSDSASDIHFHDDDENEKVPSNESESFCAVINLNMIYFQIRSQLLQEKT
jgi:hypothetical protein